jgi:energy-coupling factor transport system substrate-specific component
MLNGLFAGFSAWWVPYLYIWTVLWGITMLLPKKTPRWLKLIVYPTVCALHGLFFGTLYAPVQALMFGFDFEQTLAWIASGFPFDLIHGISNLVLGMLVIPLCDYVIRLKDKYLKN